MGLWYKFLRSVTYDEVAMLLPAKGTDGNVSLALTAKAWQ